MTSCALVGNPRRRKNRGGTVRPVRSRAGSPHGEPRTEPPLRGDAALAKGAPHSLGHYSYRSASMGSIRDAFRAG